MSSTEEEVELVSAGVKAGAEVRELAAAADRLKVRRHDVHSRFRNFPPLCPRTW